jgi:hypothetical protein
MVCYDQIFVSYCSHQRQSCWDQRLRCGDATVRTLEFFEKSVGKRSYTKKYAAGSQVGHCNLQPWIFVEWVEVLITGLAIIRISMLTQPSSYCESVLDWPKNRFTISPRIFCVTVTVNLSQNKLQNRTIINLKFLSVFLAPFQTLTASARALRWVLSHDTEFVSDHNRYEKLHHQE